MVDEESPIFGLGRYAGASKSPSRQIADKEERRNKRPTRTDTGEDTNDIIDDWKDWMRKATGVPFPERYATILRSEVKSLIASGFTTTQIKYGLAIWAVERHDNPRLSPTNLNDYAWRYAMDSSPQGQQWRDAMRQRVRHFTGVTADHSPKTQREQRTATAQQEWLQKRADRGEQ